MSLRRRGGVEVCTAVTADTRDFPGTIDLWGNAAWEVVAYTIDNCGIVDALAASANRLGAKVDPVTLLTHFEALNQSDVDAAGDGIAELPQGLPFRAKTAVIFHVHFWAARSTPKLSTVHTPCKPKDLALSTRV